MINSLLTRRTAWAAFGLSGFFVLCGSTWAAERWPVRSGPTKLLTSQGTNGEFPGWGSFHQGDDIKTADVWRLDDKGVLTCKGTPLGYLHTKKDYRDFRLTLEWRWPPGEEPGKGGVLIRTTGKNRIWPKSLEAQINTGDAGDFWGLCGYKLSGPTERSQTLEHPDFGTLRNVKKTANVERKSGEWNTYEILAQGDRVTLKINGKVVNQATGCDVVAGKILLTAEGNPIQFRKITITEFGK